VPLASRQYAHVSTIVYFCCHGDTESGTGSFPDRFTYCSVARWKYDFQREIAIVMPCSTIHVDGAHPQIAFAMDLDIAMAICLHDFFGQSWSTDAECECRSEGSFAAPGIQSTSVLARR
jgi:hypothetical protein